MYMVRLQLRLLRCGSMGSDREPHSQLRLSKPLHLRHWVFFAIHRVWRVRGHHRHVLNLSSRPVLFGGRYACSSVLVLTGLRQHGSGVLHLRHHCAHVRPVPGRVLVRRRERTAGSLPCGHVQRERPDHGVLPVHV